MFDKRQIDIYLSAVIFLIFAGLSAFAYAAILRIEAPTHVFMRAITEGSTDYYIVNNDKCIGLFSTTLTADQNSVVQSSGEANGKYGANRITAKVNFLAQFNPLGQLIDGTLQVQAPDIDIQIQSREINPIRMHLQATVNRKFFQYDFTIPGPILLKKLPDASRQIQYSQFNAKSGNMLRIFGSNLFSDADVKLVDAATSDVRCGRSERSYLDLTSIVSRVKTTEGALNSFMPSPTDKDTYD
jgi:hypothetical protein